MDDHLTIFEETAGICAQFAVPTPAQQPRQQESLPQSGGTGSGFPKNFHEVSSSPASRPTAAYVGHPRFAPLSALPPDKRLPKLRSEIPPATAPGGLAPRQLPGIPSAKPVMSQPAKQIGFNCPSCLAILIIRQPEAYDGGAAPCPGCGVSILPPRIAAVSSPFTLLSAASAQPHGLPQVQAAAQRPLQTSPRVLPPAPPTLGQAIPMGVPVSQKPGLPGARKLAHVAML